MTFSVAIFVFSNFVLRKSDTRYFLHAKYVISFGLLVVGALAVVDLAPFLQRPVDLLGPPRGDLVALQQGHELVLGRALLLRQQVASLK